LVKPIVLLLVMCLEKVRNAKGRKFRLFYFAEHILLVITLPSHPDEVLHKHLDDRIFLVLARMGLEHPWKPLGRSTGGGEGDSCQAPDMTTLVIEDEYSQSLCWLQMKMRWWFLPSNRTVRIVLLVKLDRTRRLDTTCPGNPTKQGPRYSFKSSKRMASPITTKGGSIQQSYEVTSDLPLLLESDHLFDRPAAMGEVDVIFSVQDSQLYAANVWMRV
jgi:hypothetical protein